VGRNAVRWLRCAFGRTGDVTTSISHASSHLQSKGHILPPYAPLESGAEPSQVSFLPFQGVRHGCLVLVFGETPPPFSDRGGPFSTAPHPFPLKVPVACSLFLGSVHCLERFFGVRQRFFEGGPTERPGLRPTPRFGGITPHRLLRGRVTSIFF